VISEGKTVSFGDVARPRDDDTRLSVAQRILELGIESYRFAIAMAIICVMAGAAFTAGTVPAAPLWIQLLTFGLMGLLPAILLYTGGWVMFLALRIVSEIYDPIALVLSVTIRATIIVPLGILWRHISTLAILAHRNVLSPAGRGIFILSKIFASLSWKLFKSIMSFLITLSLYSIRVIFRLTPVAVYVLSFPVRLVAKTMLKLSAKRDVGKMPVSTAPPGVMARAA
jgi:hypothetical protein